MIHLLKRFFEDIHRIANATFIQQEVSVTLSQEDRDLLANYRRRKPKKEVA